MEHHGKTVGGQRVGRAAAWRLGLVAALGALAGCQAPAAAGLVESAAAPPPATVEAEEPPPAPLVLEADPPEGPQALAPAFARSFLVELFEPSEPFDAWVVGGCTPAGEPFLQAAQRSLVLGDPRAALHLLEEAGEAAPDDPAVWRAHGLLVAAFGFPRAAEADLERAASLEPSCPSTWRALGLARLELGLHHAAADALHHSLELGRGSPSTWVALGRALREDDPCAAQEAYATAAASGAPLDPDVLVEAASVALLVPPERLAPEHVARALAWCRRAAQRDAESGRPHLVEGLVLARVGREEEARVAFLRARELDPELAELELVGAAPAPR